jgi:hypothetical protein
VIDANYSGSASGTLVVTEESIPDGFCDTAPANSAHFCDDFEDGLACADPGRTPIYTSQAASDIDCASETTPIDGAHSLEFTTGTANDQLHCDDGGGAGCFGSAIEGISCTRFVVRVDDDGTSTFVQDLFVPRDSGDSENISFGINPDDSGPATDMDAFIQPAGTILQNSMQEGIAKVWCIEQDFSNFENNIYSGGNCDSAEALQSSWNWTGDFGGFRIRAFLDNANVHIDNITVHEGSCQSIW